VEAEGGEPARPAVFDPFDEAESVKVAFLTLEALIRMPSSSGWIS
jgi:hypothetical protein